MMQFLDVVSSAVAHTATQTTHHLIDDLLYGALVGNTSGDAFGNQLLGLLDTSLEIAVGTALLHGLQRAHSAVCLELTSVVEDGLTGCLFRTGHQRTHHHAVTSGSQCLHHVTAVTQSTVSNQRYSRTLQGSCYVIDGTQLGHADTSHHTRGADAARADAHLDGISASLDQHTCCLAGSDVAYHDIHLGEGCLGLAHLFDDTLGMSVCRVDDDGINARLHQGLHTLEGIGCHTHSGSHAQTSLGILASHGLVGRLGDVLVGDETDEVVLFIHYGKFLYLVLQENLAGTLQVSLLVRHHQVLLGHHLVYLAAQVRLETEVTVGHDAHQLVVLIDHGNTSDVVFGHEVQGILHCLASHDGDRVVDHTVLGTLHDGHLACLLLDGHILVDYTNATLARYGDGHGCLGNSVHSRRYEGNLQVDVS